MQTLKIDIRPAQASDAGAITTILRKQGFRHLLAQAEAEAEDGVRQRLQQSDEDGGHSVFVAALGENATLGFVAVSWTRSLRYGIDGYVSELFVLEEARGKGIGTALLEAVKREALARDCSRLILWMRRDSDAYVKGFYTDAGWRERDDLVLLNLHLENLSE